MEKWQKEIVNSITITHKSYDKEYALKLAKEWEQTDEKFCFIMDEFAMSANDNRCDYWVDRIENQFMKTLEANKETLSETAESWLWLCNQ